MGQIPVANFTANTISGCSPLVVTFKDLSSNGPTSWLWDFGNSSISTDPNPTATYFTPGTYNVKLTVTNANGNNTLTRTNYITVYSAPTVNFSAGNTVGCFPLPVQFTDLSTAGTGNVNTQWQWNFGDGAISNQQSPAHTYASAGNFNIILKVTNDKGCSKVLSKPAYIQVSPGAVADFTNTAPLSCTPPVNIDFTNISTGPGTLTYLWNFGDGTTSTLQNPSHTYNVTGSFNVTLTTSSTLGCSSTTVKNNTVVLSPNITSFSVVDTVTVNNNATFTNTSNPLPSSQSWNFGDGNSSTAANPVKAYTIPGTYSVTLANTYGNCSFNVTKTIVVISNTLANFSSSDTISCQIPYLVHFQDQSIGAVSWLWDFGDSSLGSTAKNPIHTYTSYGNFNVSLISTNATGRKDTITKTNFIKIARATIDVTGLPANGCVPFTINPNPNITTFGTVTSYLWNFGDGFSSTLKTPSHTYSLPGTYTVRLIITTSLGCSDTLTIPNAVRVGTKPTANFSATPLIACIKSPVQFTDLSILADEWNWDFGDGNYDANKNPSHSFPIPGTFNVTLTIKNNGCPDSLKKISYINILPPLSGIGLTPDCSLRTKFTFTDKSTGPLSWKWDFGDGSPLSILQNPPPHIFPSLGAYSVSLIVTNGGCADTSSLPIRAINENPDFTSNSLAGCRKTDILFTATNINAANITQFDWDFGDGTNMGVTDTTVTHRYANSGNYTVSLVTTDLNGCKDTIIKNSYFRANGPVANFNGINTGGCNGLTAIFNDLSTTDGVNPIISWQWSYGDGTVQTFASPISIHTYNTVGTFSVTLKVLDASGCFDTITVNDLVHSTDPSVTFSTTDTLTCPGANISWKVTATGTINNYLWNFGDGTTSPLGSPPKSYSNTGSYSVKLFVTDSYGCTDSLFRSNYINVSVPLANFTIDDSVSSCAPFEVNFTNKSTFYSSQLWTFEPGIISSLQNPAHYYLTPGVYNAELIVTSPGGCMDTAYRTVRLFDNASTTITYNPLNGCKPQAVDFNVVTNGPATYFWDFGDGQSLSSIAASITHTYNTFGDFTPKIILQDPTGCLTPITGSATVSIVGAIAKFGLDKTKLCSDELVNFIDSTTFNDPITSYTWNFGDGNISNLQNPSHFYSGTGTYSIYLAVKTQLGCVDTAHKNNALKILASPRARIDGDSAICKSSPLQLFGNLLAQDTSTVTWNWSFGNGNISTLPNPPVQTYDSSGNYVVSLITASSNGCIDTTTKNIHIHPLPTVSMPPDITVVAGSTFTIPANYSGNMSTYLWSPTIFLSCNTCPQPDVTPDYDKNYIVSFTDSNGCRNTGSILIKTLCKNAKVFVPNTFSPNGDGSNDAFFPRGSGINRVKFLRIFNRWGEVVFEKYDFPINDAQSGWDGKWKGKKANPDVYIYQLELYCLNGEILTYSGNVALIQ